MYEPNIEMELEYWRNKVTDDYWEKRYQSMLNVLGIRLEDLVDKSVIDIGPGPYGGIFWHLDSKEMFIVEPLIEIYVRDGYWKLDKDLRFIDKRLEDINVLPYEKKFDVVIACNSIDHGDNIWKGIEKISRILKDDGVFYLLVHCRSERQLNAGHKQAFSPEDLISFLSKFFDVSELKISSKDPMYDGKKYKTVYGRLTKRKSINTCC